MVCLIADIFGMLHTQGHFFDTLDILGAHSGTSEPSGIINHHGRALRGDSKTKKCCQTHKLLFTVFVLPLYAHQETRVAFDAQLIWSQNKCLDFYWRNWGCNISSAVTDHTAQIFKHVHTCWPETSQSWFALMFLLNKPQFNDRKQYRQLHSSWNLKEILALSPPGVCQAAGTWANGRGNRDEAGGGDGLGGIDPLCAHCAERSVPAPYPWQPFVVQPNCLSYISCTFENEPHCKRQWTESRYSDTSSSASICVRILMLNCILRFRC